MLPSPREILATLLPHLRVAARYAQQIQPYIAARPSKAGNLFAAALSDADLSIQTLVEVALLGHFPNIRFYGEEFEQAYNTKYFRAIDLGPPGDYLVTLDPIDGTQFYLDGHPNYQIILTVLDADEFAAAIALNPAHHTYYYALRNEGCWQGSLNDDLENCRPLTVNPPDPVIFLGWGLGRFAPLLQSNYRVIDIATDYSREHPVPSVNGILTGEVSGVVLRGGKFIDGAALAFLAQEAGCIITTWEGTPLPPLHTSESYSRPPLLMATSPAVHQHLLAAVRGETPSNPG